MLVKNWFNKWLLTKFIAMLISYCDLHADFLLQYNVFEKVFSDKKLKLAIKKDLKFLNQYIKVKKAYKILK